MIRESWSTETRLPRLSATPIDAVRAATANAARLLRLDREIGTIERGRAADLLAVERDPLEDVRALEQVCLVVRSGAVVKNQCSRSQ
jgi:imidazolonepropionase-like amidohydrolase